MKRFLWFFMLFFISLGGCGFYPHPEKPSPDVGPLPGKWVPGARPYEVNGIRYFPLPDAVGFVEYGKASWYGKQFHGLPTASGRVYDMHAMSAAHKTLPLDTMVRVINLSNRKSIFVPINDRGPFVSGRVIDLSYAAAKELDMIGPGVVEVKVEALAREVSRQDSEGRSIPGLEWQDFRKGEFTVQIGAFKDKTNALKLADRFREVFDFINIAAYRDETGMLFYRVHVSKSESLDEAGSIGKRLGEMGFPNAFVVRL
ncbi:MAG: septal ring lytic transglycosylase RlpA family protein [Deltaproteobacteria bacterium]|nr:septal ring lytic transglycosylase RlpA family protein [Deltaproteobacteria bacterium]